MRTCPWNSSPPRKICGVYREFWMYQKKQLWAIPKTPVPLQIKKENQVISHSEFQGELWIRRVLVASLLLLSERSWDKSEPDNVLDLSGWRYSTMHPILLPLQLKQILILACFKMGTNSIHTEASFKHWRDFHLTTRGNHISRNHYFVSHFFFTVSVPFFSFLPRRGDSMAENCHAA